MPAGYVGSTEKSSRHLYPKGCRCFFVITARKVNHTAEKLRNHKFLLAMLKGSLIVLFLKMRYGSISLPKM